MSWEPFSDIEVYEFLLGKEIRTDIGYISPFRKEKDESFRFSYFKDKLYWKDFGGLDINPAVGTRRDVVGYLIQQEGLGSRKEGEDFYVQLCNSADFKNFLVTRKNPNLRKEKIEHKKAIYKVRSHWKQYELDYWNRESELLRKNEIFPCESFKYSHKSGDLGSTPESPAFLYFFNNRTAYKLYRPKESIKTGKWKSDNLKNVIEGYEQLPLTSDEMIISSCTKDRLTIKVYLGIDGIAPTGETTWNNILSRVREFNSRFRNIYVWLDADETGYKWTKFICELTGWNGIYPPLWFKDNGMKDQTDMANKSPLFFRDFWKIN